MCQHCKSLIPFLSYNYNWPSGSLKRSLEQLFNSEWRDRHAGQVSPHIYIRLTGLKKNETAARVSSDVNRDVHVRSGSTAAVHLMNTELLPQFCLYVLRPKNFRKHGLCIIIIHCPELYYIRLYTFPSIFNCAPIGCFNVFQTGCIQTRCCVTFLYPHWPQQTGKKKSFALPTASL